MKIKEATELVSYGLGKLMNIQKALENGMSKALTRHANLPNNSPELEGLETKTIEYHNQLLEVREALIMLHEQVGGYICFNFKKENFPFETENGFIFTSYN